MAKQSMTAQTMSMTLGATPSRIGRRTDSRGVAIGPWSDSVKRATVLLRASRR